MVNFFLDIGVINENSKQIGTFTCINQLYEAKDRNDGIYKDEKNPKKISNNISNDNCDGDDSI